MNLRILIVTAGALLAAGGAAAAPTELKFGHYLVESHPAHAAAVAFADAVAARTHGAVKVTIFANSKLGSTQEMVEQTTMGALDLVIPTEPAIAKYVKKFNMVGAPFAFKDYAATDRFSPGTSSSGSPPTWSGPGSSTSPGGNTASAPTPPPPARSTGPRT